ncbi:MAG: AraC family transcriptional activator of pobA [Planctomycetota bacterium]
MEDIKTYNQVNVGEDTLDFRISKMEDIYEKLKDLPDVPHRHDYFTVILTIKANGQHFIDFNEYALEANQVFFVSPGQVHNIVQKEKSFGYSLLFSKEFLINNNIPISFIEDLNLFNDFGYTPPLKVNEEQLKTLTSYCEEILTFYNQNLKFREQAFGAILKLFLIQCNNICPQPNDNLQIVEAGYSILRKFKDAVENHHKEWHATSQYADVLNISPDHLNRTVKSLIGKNAKEYIQDRINISARRLLYFTDTSTKEVAFQLGFSEASNFSNFFKKHNQKSPSSFKKMKISR